jgi:23S rRNA pseudouridine1911/1915/1917 synthase
VTRTRRWVLDGEHHSLRAALEHHAGDDLGAIADGRAFLNGRRSRDGATRIDAGDILEVVAARRAGAGLIRVISNRDGIVAADKPAGVPTEPDRRGGSASVVEAVARLLGWQPGSLHAASRLDLGVSGVVLLAATRDARHRLANWRNSGRLSRRYVAIGSGLPVASSGIWEGPVSKRDTRPAATRFRSVATVNSAPDGSACLLALAPVTGRFHQIRIHAAAAGLPLLGDPVNGGPRRFVDADGEVIGYERIGLHALWVEVAGEREELRWVSPVPELLGMWWKRLGGQPEDWSAASECHIP